MATKRVKTKLLINPPISLPQNEEILVLSQSGYGELLFISTVVNVKNHFIKLVIDNEEVFNMDFSEMLDTFMWDTNITNLPFTIEIKKGEYVFRFCPKEKIQFLFSCNIYIKNYKNMNKQLDNAIIMWQEQEQI